MPKPVSDKNDLKIALALSGGGYRATVFTLGALKQLNAMGLLSRVSTITSVSGGSITSALLAKNWGYLNFNEHGVALNFHEKIEDPLQRFCMTSIDMRSVLGGLISFRESIGDKVARAYDKKLYEGFTLKGINSFESAPLFIFYGTNFQTGASVRLSQKYISDWRLGYNEKDDIPLSKAVGISSAFPPVLSPVNLQLNPSNWIKTKYSTHNDNKSMLSKMVLTDGGLYDNLGLEAITKTSKKPEYDYVICCDAGAPFEVSENAKTNWISQTARMTEVMINQQRALRKRKLIEDIFEGKFKGTYFGIGNKINDYTESAKKQFGRNITPILTDSVSTKSLAKVPTRLKALNNETITELQDWGSALCDVALKCWCNELIEI
ncbi:patatin-like phospholipase family protein [Salinimonas chungwhensis]|uniref:patatin-like phospholipase family protein n=1 Tax=Salinimonas chungwhensis TaxID=265425 RepID=UPI0003603021|nr:patatin-like phospholipase family protein [Salinimonas chungwhensis]